MVPQRKIRLTLSFEVSITLYHHCGFYNFFLYTSSSPTIASNPGRYYLNSCKLVTTYYNYLNFQ